MLASLASHYFRPQLSLRRSGWLRIHASGIGVSYILLLTAFYVEWGTLMRWMINQQFFRANLELGPGGETGPVNDMIRKTTERIGANIMGKRMSEQGERAWPENARGVNRPSSPCPLLYK